MAESPERRDGVSPGSISLGELVQFHLDRWAGSPTTLATYRGITELHIKPTIGRYDIKKVTPKLLDDFYVYLQTKRNLSPGSVRQVHAIIRGSLTQAVKWGWLAANPARDATLPRRQKNEITLPTKDEVLRILQHAEADDPVMAMFFRLSAVTGARRGELCALCWTDFDARAQTLVIARSMAYVRNEGTFAKDTKNHSKRTIALDPATVEALTSYGRRMAERAADVEVDYHRDAFIFSVMPDGSRPLHPDYVTHSWRRICTAAGVTGVRLHDLRHYQATMLLQAGVPVKNVSARIGHRDAATTLNVYAHFLEDVDTLAATVAGGLVDDTRHDDGSNTKGAAARPRPRRRRSSVTRA